MNIPVALLLFNRPDTTARLLDTLRHVRPTFLFVVADGPRPTRAADAEQCAATRAVIDTVDWECEIFKNYAGTNLGAKQRIESGLDWVFEQAEQAIIFEDDCIPDLSFFLFCDELLARYRDEPRVMGISGSNLQLDSYQSPYSFHFSRYPLAWGWATWRRAWRLYDGTLRDWPSLRAGHWLHTRLETPLMVRYWDTLFQQNYDDPHAYDYAWTMATWQHDGLHVVPNLNLVSNIGFRPDALHTVDPDDVFSNLPARTIEFPLKHPPTISRDVAADLITEEKAFSGKDFLKLMFSATHRYIQSHK